MVWPNASLVVGHYCLLGTLFFHDPFEGPSNIRSSNFNRYHWHADDDVIGQINPPLSRQCPCVFDDDRAVDDSAFNDRQITVATMDRFVGRSLVFSDASLRTLVLWRLSGYLAMIWRRWWLQTL